MLNRLFGEKFHSNFHVFVLLVLLVGLCCSKFLMSMGLLLGGLNFFLEGNLKEKLSRLKENKFFLIIFGFYFFHVLGMLWTQNWDYGLNELRQKKFTRNHLNYYFLTPFAKQETIEFIAVSVHFNVSYYFPF